MKQLTVNKKFCEYCQTLQCSEVSIISEHFIPDHQLPRYPKTQQRWEKQHRILWSDRQCCLAVQEAIFQ